MFCDASVAVQQIPHQLKLELAYYSHFTVHSLFSASFFQVAIPHALCPLEAEAQTLLLGAKLAAALSLPDDQIPR